MHRSFVRQLAALLVLGFLLIGAAKSTQAATCKINTFKADFNNPKSLFDFVNWNFTVSSSTTGQYSGVITLVVESFVDSSGQTHTVSNGNIGLAIVTGNTNSTPSFVAGGITVAVQGQIQGQTQFSSCRSATYYYLLQATVAVNGSVVAAAMQKTDSNTDTFM